MRNIISKFLFTLVVLTIGIGSAWGTCPTAGTIYKFVVKTGLTNNSNITDQDIAITTSNYLSSFAGSTGATLSAYNKDKKFQIADNSCFKLTDGSKSYLILDLGDCTIQAGDIVKTIITSQNAYLYTSTSKDDTNKALITKSSGKTVYNTLLVTSEMDIVGSSILYLYNASNSSQVYSVEIIRPYTITLDATTNGGTAVDPVKGASGDKVVLTHAFKKDTEPVKYYKFKGWYTSATGGTKQVNLYTISGDATFVAQFEAFPESGDLFTLEMEDGLKPAANCTIKTASGYASQVDMLTYATIEGGAAFFKNASSNNHAIITSAGKINFNGSNAVMEIPLDFALQNGDEIQTDFSAKIWVSSSTTKPSSGPYVDGDNKNYTVIEGDGLKDATTLYLYTGTSGATASSIVITRPAPAATYTVTLNPAGGSIDPVPSGWTLTAGQYVKTDIEDGSSVALLALTKDGYKLNGWKDGENADYTSPVTIDGADLTLTAQWAQTYAVTYVPNNGVLPAETMTDNNAPYKAGDEVTLLANTFTAPENKEFDAWVVTPTAGGDPITVTAGKFTMPAAAVTVTATWKDACALAPTVSATTLGTTSYTTQVVNCAGISVLGSAGCTISEYGFVYGTATAPTISDNKKALEGDYTVAGTAFPATTLTGLAMNTKYYVRAYATNSYGTAYGDEVNFTTLESLGNVLVVASSASQTSDAITALRDNGFMVTVSAHDNSRDYTGYDLVVLDESLNGGDAQTAANEESKIKDVNIPILNLKAFFYTKTNRWNWGTPVNGTAANEIANLSTAYCNAQDHPIFAGLTINEGAIDLIDPAKSGNTLQGVTTNTLVEGKVGYTLATSGTGITFIHELTPSQRGVDAKYLMIAISNNAKDNLSADGEKLIVNAAKYLVGSTPWTPIVAPTSPEVTATPSENYTEGNTITLTASATGTTASTTYTWYKGADWATASAAPAVQAAATAAADGNVFTKTAAVEDAGTYWCNISNGTSCDVQASVTITVSSASTPTHAISYDNLKGVDVSAYPTEYTEGVGVASFDPLADITGWHFVEWSPASIGTDATTDQTITAVWKQVFAVTFNMQDHGDAIDAQNIVDGGKVIAPTAPTATDYDFGGWYKEAGCTNAWDFANDVVTENTELFAKWTADPCGSSERKSLSKVVLTATDNGTVTGYNANEYAGEKVIGGLSSTQAAEVDPSHEGTETGYKLNNGGSAIVFATLKKGTFQEGDRVVVTITKKQDAYKVAEVAQPILDIYYGTNKDDATFLATIDNVTDAGSYTYRLTAADITAIGDKKGIGVFRPSSGRTQNPYIYSVEIQGCRSWAVFHTLTFKNIDGTVNVATPALEEGAYASTVAPAAPKIAMKRFLGWSESVGGALVELTSYTITADAILYAVYEDIVCPTTGTVYKFVVKDGLASENLLTSTDKDMSSYVDVTGDGYLTYTATADNKATVNSDGTIQLKDATAAYLKVELECTLTAGDQIRSNISNNPMRVQVATTFDADDDLILAKNVYNTVDITSAMVGKNVLYIARSTNGNANIADFEIYRPAKFDVSFDMMGHGSAIADIEDVTEGSKIVAPDPAPTDVDYSFAGWYKENTLENEWDFDNDVVNAATTLHAKWLDKSDATLKSLKYGDEDITLVDGIYTYNISLPAFTSAVPALTAVPNNPNATAVPTNATAFDGEGNATSTVLVTPESGTPQTYTVNFSKGVEVTLQDVTGSITWDFANAVSTTVNITGTPQVLANYGGVTNIVNVFESDKLEASGEKFTAGSKANLRAKTIHFHTTVPGMLSISYSNTGGTNPARYIYVNGVKYDNDGSASTTPKGIENKVFVSAGDVYLEMKDGEGAPQNIQVYKIIFNNQADYERNVTEGRYGTICLPKAGVMAGADIYEVAYYGATSKKIFFDEILGGVMEAGVPYIFLPKEGVSTLGVFYTDAAAETAKSANGLVGFIGADENAETSVPEGMYILQNNQYREVLAGADARIKSYRAYINLGAITPTAPALAPGRRRISMGVTSENSATGMDELNASETPVKMMIDGQLYILRGEKLYDATGRLVK